MSQVHCSPQDIRRMVAEAFGVEVEDISSTVNIRKVVQTRNITAMLISKNTDSNQAQVGQYIGGRSIGEVIQACKAAEALTITNPEIGTIVRELQRKIAIPRPEKPLATSNGQPLVFRTH